MEQHTEVVARGARERRHDARTQAFAARRALTPQPTESYRTPVWLERSFVLPVADTMPAQPAPGHDDLDVSAHVLTATAPAEPAFVRPPSPEVDFAEVVRRHDAARLARRTALGAFLLALLTALVALVVPSQVVLPVLAVAAVAGVVAVLWRDGLSRAPIPLRG